MSLAAMFRLQKPEIFQYDVAAPALLCNSAVEINWFRLVWPSMQFAHCARLAIGPVCQLTTQRRVFPCEWFS